MIRRLRALASSATATTVLTNYGIVAVGFLGSLVLARGLAPEGRGSYAALASALALVLVLGEFGQSGAVSYWVARHPSSALAIARQARHIMLLGAIVVGMLLCMALVVSGQSAWLMVTLIATLLVNALGAPHLYALLATHPTAWNRVRLVQPLTSMVLILALLALDHLSVESALASLVLSYFAGVGAAVAAHPRLVATDPQESNPHDWRQNLLRFGSREFLGGVPFVASQHLDKVVLALYLSAGALGQYVVALSIIALCPPLANGVATMLAPQMASGAAGSAEAVRRVAAGVAVSGALVLCVCIAGTQLVPVLFGADYTSAATLCMWLIPAGLGRSVSMVCSGFLRGSGRPQHIALLYWVSAGVTLGGLLVLGDALTPAAACVMLGIGECLGAVLGIVLVRRQALQCTALDSASG